MRRPRAVLAVVMAMGLTGCGESHEQDVGLRLGARADLLLDTARVELVKGFGAGARLGVWSGLADDSDDVAVPLPAPSTLRWTLDTPPGRLTARVARLVAPGEDGGRPLRVRVTALAAGPAPEVVVDVPAAPPSGPQSGFPRGQRMGPAADLVLELPAGAASLTLSVEAPDGPPDGGGGLVALLSPRVTAEPRLVTGDAPPLEWERSHSLLGSVAPCTDTVTFARRKDEQGEEPVALCAVEAVGSFTPRQPRPALALTGAGSARFELDLREDTRLRLAVSLDDRLHAGASARAEVWLDGEPLHAERVTSPVWHELEFAIPGRSGTSVLEFAVREPELEPDWVELDEVDLARRTLVRAAWRASEVRVGFADPRLVTKAAVPRRAAGPGRPSVIIVHTETLRADVLSPWAGDSPASGGDPIDPRLAALAEEAVVWDCAIAPSPWTLPSTATLLTGLLPSAHGVVKRDRPVLPPDVPTLAELASEQGIVTGALMANDLLRRDAGFARGFSSYVELPDTDAPRVMGLARGFLERHRDEQFLLVLHMWDPHYPYNARGRFRGAHVDAQFADADPHAAMTRVLESLRDGEVPLPDDPDVRLSRQRYLGEVSFWDHELGGLIDLLDELELSESTVVIVTADHGEAFMEHGMIGHGTRLYDEDVRVPLLAVAPGGQLGPPRRVPGVASTAGLFAFVADLLDVPYDRDAVMPALSAERPGRYAFTETNQGLVRGHSDDVMSRHLTAVRSADHLLVWRHPLAGEDGPVEEEFYDLRADPGATVSLAPEGEAYEELAERMAAALAWSAERRAPSPLTGMDAEWLEALQRIGYVDAPEER